MIRDEMKNRISMALKDSALQQGFEIICKENKELEEKISVLLSCKNCSENKGGWICVKEYENKCLAQKIEFIKELKKENVELKEKVSYLEDNLRVARKDREDLQLEVARGLKEFVKDFPATAIRYLANEEYVERLAKAKEIIKKLYSHIFQGMGIMEINDYDVQKAEAEQFISEVENQLNH